MICVANQCGQDSRNCKTPWRCSGKYESEAHYAAMTRPLEPPLPITMEDDEPAASKSSLSLMCAVAAAVALAVFGWLFWPHLAALWRLS